MFATPKKWTCVIGLLAGGCTIRSIATSSLADTFAASGGGYGSDEDPELVAGAVPFALKTMEQVLDEQPRHIGLLTALARGFAQYAYAFVQQDADFLEERDIARAKEVQARARRLFLRARGYGVRGLDVAHPGFSAALASPATRAAAVAGLTKSDVPLIYWTAASWALAVADAKGDMRLVADLPTVEALMDRALALDEAWDGGAIHEFFVAYDGSRDKDAGGGPERAKAHLDRARALGGNKRLGPLVSYAESVSVARQDKNEFTRLLEEVVASDVDRHPTERLANIVAQRRARWLLGRRADLFAE